MPDSLQFSYLNANFPPEEAARRQPEELAAMGRLLISANGNLMTRGNSLRDNMELQDGPIVGNYYCAQWLAWNYWRLRWEGRSRPGNETAWRAAHSMRSIGHGYVWPDISFISDGERLLLSSRLAQTENAGAFKYKGAPSAIISATEFDRAFTVYVEQVLADISAAKLAETNLNILWRDLQEEIHTPQLAQKRRLEALLGFDPDEGNEAEINSLIEAAQKYDEAAAQELAAQSSGASVAGVKEIEFYLAKYGAEGDKRDRIKFDDIKGLSQRGRIPAWAAGREAAQSLRRQAGLTEIIDTKYLAEIAGLSAETLASAAGDPEFSLSAPESGDKIYFALSGKRETSRRFAAARLLADSILYQDEEKLRIAGSAYTYRQKAQRAFAAEFLCPIENLKDFLSGKYSDEEKIEDAADHFNVSVRTVEASLANHGLINRHDVRDIDAAAANDNDNELILQA